MCTDSICALSGPPCSLCLIAGLGACRPVDVQDCADEGAGLVAMCGAVRTWDETRGEWVALPAGDDTDPGACGAGGDCGEPSTWGPPYDPGQHPYHVALALVWARVILRDAPEDWRVVRANLKCARWYASRANLAHLRRWGRVSVPRWTPRHPHPLTTV